MDTFLCTYSLPKPNQDNVENFNRPIAINDIKSVGKEPIKNTQDHMASLLNSNNQWKNRLIQILLKLFQTIEKREFFQTLSISPLLTCYQNQIRTQQREKTRSNIHYEHRHKYSHPNPVKLIPAMLKRLFMTKWTSSQRCSIQAKQ
jgi:hypothetical protein